MRDKTSTPVEAAFKQFQANAIRVGKKAIKDEDRMALLMSKGAEYWLEHAPEEQRIEFFACVEAQVSEADVKLIGTHARRPEGAIMEAEVEKKRKVIETERADAKAGKVAEAEQRLREIYENLHKRFGEAPISDQSFAEDVTSA